MTPGVTEGSTGQLIALLLSQSPPQHAWSQILDSLVSFSQTERIVEG